VKGLHQKTNQVDPTPLAMTLSTPTERAHVVIVGARGRMGRAVIEAIEAHDSCSVAARLDRGDALPDEGDLVIDFSSDDGAKMALAASERRSAPLFVGTTALSAGTLEALETRSRQVPVMIASNASLGVAAMHRMVTIAMQALGPSWKVRLTETHHTRKVDAPSGTALALAETVRHAGGELSAESIRSIREGDVVGHHVLELEGQGETLRLSHEAHDRSLFARGALTLALWLRTQPPGMHSVQAWLNERIQGRMRP
jgi:4-hydroxy-tetrahydrodipicolinate reductase